MTTHVCAFWRSVDANDPAGPYVCEECGAPMPERPATTPCPKCGALLPVDEVLAHGECGYVMENREGRQRPMTDPSNDVREEDLASLTELVEPSTLVVGDRFVFKREGLYSHDHVFPVYVYDGPACHRADGTGNRVFINPAEHTVYKLK